MSDVVIGTRDALSAGDNASFTRVKAWFPNLC